MYILSKTDTIEEKYACRCVKYAAKSTLRNFKPFVYENKCIFYHVFGPWFSFAIRTYAWNLESVFLITRKEALSFFTTISFLMGPNFLLMW